MKEISIKWKIFNVCIVSVTAHLAVYNADFVYDDEPALLNNADVQVYCVRLFVQSLSSCHEKATVAIYFGRIRTRLWVVHFWVFRLFLWLLTTEFAACSKPSSKLSGLQVCYSCTGIYWINKSMAEMGTDPDLESKFGG